MDDQGTPATAPSSDADQLYELIRAGGFWRLAPDWVPRTGYTVPGKGGLHRMADKLLALSVPGPGETW
ncbi:hypothetical protein DVH02_25795 [Streptomyces corynorhini]|uniref:Uncharacterized protein n=1 Tax=Streptomyces corynorhini TaxID=2282652 RepID=A0A370B6I0_9ACTN|nr:hypothetical protein DVH02_25830 [Streptomyces corynorhini]RDG35356.1 hypothetical protein DVH02_25795 [Streptomyces corynorhini]